MSKPIHIVDGEASESESEIELGKSPETELPSQSETFIIAGEAPESDDETKTPSPCKTDASNMASQGASPPRYPSKFNYSSLLHQKLWECNVSLRATIDGLLKHTTDIAIDKLSRADKTLLHVQESMRATNANLALARARLKQIHTAMDNANCSAVLPTVKITQ